MRWRHDGRAVAIIWVDDAWAARELMVWSILPASTDGRIVLESLAGTPEWKDAQLQLTGWLELSGAWVIRAEAQELLLRVTGNGVELELGFGDPHSTGFPEAWTCTVVISDRPPV